MITTDYEVLERECVKRNWSAEKLCALCGALKRITFIPQWYKNNTAPSYRPILHSKYTPMGHGSDMARKIRKAK
jgi:hypothetical protein